MVYRKYYTWKELVKEIPELAKFSKSKIGEDIEDVLFLIDMWAEDNKLELFQVLVIFDQSIKFIFNEKT